MSLPDESNPDPADTAGGPGEERHLHAVPDETGSEITAALEPVVDEPTDEPAPAAEADTDGQDASEPDADKAELDGSDAGGAASATPGQRPAWAGWLAGAFTPQSGLYTARAAAPREVVHRARVGGQLADAGPLRIAARAYGYWQAAGKVTTRSVEWLLFDHPARTLLVAVLVVMLWLLLAQAT